MKLLDRYASAIHSSNLRVVPDTTFADVDVIGAAGLAAKHEPLGIELARMLSGGGRGEVVSILSDMAFERSFRLRVRVTRVQCDDMAKAVLAWYRHGTCQPCGGHGYELIPGVPSLGANECKHCNGSGRLVFDRYFRSDWLELAQWLSSQIERTQAAAGTLAMKMIAPRMEL